MLRIIRAYDSLKCSFFIANFHGKNTIDLKENQVAIILCSFTLLALFKNITKEYL